jgi:hypothetical protein
LGKHQEAATTFRLKVRGRTLVVRPVNGEEHFEEPGFSHGFVHLVDPVTGKRMGFCGIDYFEAHARQVAAPA